MTTIESGGGPTLEQKRSFSGLKDGALIPGYRGHCPELKFRIGKTFGQETSELTQDRRCLRHQTEPLEGDLQPVGSFQFSGTLPASTGENKYTENMTPGYTGYVPRWPFKFGKTYKEECDACLAEFLAGQNQTKLKQQEVLSMTRSLPSLRPVCGDTTQVRDHLNSFSDRGFMHSSESQTRRHQSEAPIPGYRGYIPRVRTTEVGLGTRYHEMTKNGLENFYTARYEREKRYGPLPDTFGAQRHEPARIKRSLTTQPQAQDDAKTCSRGNAKKAYRLYAQDGMIPNYTGYVPQLRYAMGYTFGDETRSLEVCAHDESCYGDYVKQSRPQ